jgi:hypothetical protein
MIEHGRHSSQQYLLSSGICTEKLLNFTEWVDIALYFSGIIKQLEIELKNNFEAKNKAKKVRIMSSVLYISFISILLIRIFNLDPRGISYLKK